MDTPSETLVPSSRGRTADGEGLIPKKSFSEMWSRRCFIRIVRTTTIFQPLLRALRISTCGSRKGVRAGHKREHSEIIPALQISDSQGSPKCDRHLSSGRSRRGSCSRFSFVSPWHWSKLSTDPLVEPWTTERPPHSVCTYSPHHVPPRHYNAGM
jgi:hypothetical protein